MGDPDPEPWDADFDPSVPPPPRLLPAVSVALLLVALLVLGLLGVL